MTKKTSKAATANRQPVLVCTQHRGVFFGYTKDFSGDRVRLEEARNCLYWAKSVGGFGGLATDGPNSECRIGARMKAITLADITAVVECSDAAAARWEAAPCVS